MSAQNEDREKFRPSDNMDAALQRELDEALGGASLQDLLEAEEKAAKAAAPQGGSVHKGQVIAIYGEDVFISLGGKRQGILPSAQFENGLPRIGDLIDVTIEGADRDNNLVLSREGAVMAAAWETIQVGQIVEGRVTGLNKGGLELKIDGIRAFMPISQVELFRVEDLTPYLNQKMRCEVMEVDRADKNVLLTRRSLLEKESAEQREKTFADLVEGKTVRGVVKNIMPYGAFVDIGGIDGLLHVKDMSYSRVEDPSKVVQPGQQLELMVLKVDREAKKVGLGLKQVMPDPWADVESKYVVDSMVNGRVTRLADFGAFVELEAGLEGLIPISELSFERRLKHPSDAVKEGDVVKVRVISVDAERKRVSLSLKRAGDDPWMGASARWTEGSIVEGPVKRCTEFGAFVEIATGVEGLVHISEISDTRVRAVGDVLTEGQIVKAKVLGVDEERRRISLSIKQAAATAFQEAAPAPEAAPAKPAKARKTPLKGGLE